MIELKKVNKIYEDGFQALKDINLTFDEGKINVLIGPSGCGKTTTMKLLNRLVDHSDGSIMVDGKDITQINPIHLRREMGYVIQSIGLFPHMNIYDNVATVPRLVKWDKKRIDEKVHELLELVNLEPETYKKRYPSELSGGQQQRIGVIRALAAEPNIILMDEPFSALDPISREQLQDELLRLQKEINKTIIFVTHDMDEAIKIADQIILMKDGSIVQKGSPDEILSNPENDFVKEFIGAERLQKAEKLPPLKEMVDRSIKAIDIETSTEKASTYMLENQLLHAPVEQDGKYVGMISLQNLIQSKESSVKDVSISKVSVVHISDDQTSALTLISSEQPVVAVVNDQEEVVGVLNDRAINNTFLQFYQKKQGVV
ncbi:osmoprotectant [Halalkalibacillus sediminis]|uniref:Quaternary amine transport ATP-binding protein n=1 Tax=Halalkalibacillus sediminis TaxID=2018042 RepID=A0A2I0QTL1_9BACI|nr:betaine/proline/choline family ABC transporter ATP-binding protein [Halalkalibacillus sediminis]PKR77649.1 osmoprotectant [Halalkalibacillus sediminis]